MYIVKFWSDVKDLKNPEFLRVNGAAEEVSKRFISAPKGYEMVGERRYAVYTFDSKKDAIQFLKTDEHKESISRTKEFYSDWHVIREET